MIPLENIWVKVAGDFVPDYHAVEKLGRGASQALINYLITERYLSNGIKPDEVWQYQYYLSVWQSTFTRITSLTPDMIVAAKPTTK